MSAHADKTPNSPAPTNIEYPKPYLTAGGDLVIPHNSDPKYHWWKPGGQKVDKTREELRAKAESGK
jgi:hypothetical protein